MAATVTSSLVRTILDSLVVSSGDLLLSCPVKLFSNDYQPTAQSETADMTEVVADWYSSTVDSFNASYLNDDEHAEINGGLNQHIFGSGDSDAVTVYGYYVTTAGGDLICAERFTSPQQMAADGDEISFVPRISLKSSDL